MPRGPEQIGDPRAGRGDHDGRLDAALRRVHAHDAAVRRGDALHPEPGVERSPGRLGRAEPAQHHAGHVDVAAIGLPGAAGEIVGDERRLQRLDLVGAGEPGIDAELAAELDVAPARLHLCLDDQQHVAELDVAGIADADLRLPVVEHLEAANGHLDHERVRVMLADLAKGAARHAAHRRPLVHHHDSAAGLPRELKGDARPHDPRADHHDVGGAQPPPALLRHLSPNVVPRRARIRRGRLAWAITRGLGSRSIGTGQVRGPRRLIDDRPSTSSAPVVA